MNIWYCVLIEYPCRRIHFGKFVAESKFQQETEKMVELIKKKDRKGIDEAITNAKVEKKVLERLRLKARTYGTDPSIGANAEEKINVDAVVAMYEVRDNLFLAHRFPTVNGIRRRKAPMVRRSKFCPGTAHFNHALPTSESFLWRSIESDWC